MYAKIIRGIPFSSISQVLTPGINKLPYPILRDITNNYLQTNITTPKTDTTMDNYVVIQNKKPLITSYLSFHELFNNCKSIPEYEPLHHQVNSMLVQGYFRDISTCSIPEKQMVIMRVWFEYSRKTRLIKFINIYELCNDIAWCVDTQRYFTMLQQVETVFIPSFDSNNITISGGNDRFLKKLQVMV